MFGFLHRGSSRPEMEVIYVAGVQAAAVVIVGIVGWKVAIFALEKLSKKKEINSKTKEVGYVM